jgi:protein-L-isoaspartate(D-aspartate) O-methyltransferase
MAPQPSQDGDLEAVPAGEPEIRCFVERYVRDLRAAGAIRSPGVERAFLKVERHRLLETFDHRAAGSRSAGTIHHDPGRPLHDHLELIYSDTPLVTRSVDGMPTSSSSQPSLVAGMVELLDLAGGLKVLEVGAGTGYNAALMAEIVGGQGLVVTVDVLDDVVGQTTRLLAGAGYPQIRVLLRDGFEGVPEEAPFDRIVATVGCSDLSPRWAGQLADGGTMLVPLEHAGGHPLLLIRKEDGELHGRVAMWTGFMPIRGPLHIEELWSRGVIRPETEKPVRQRDPWPGFAAERPTGPPGSLCLSADETDFLFFLGLHDRRACVAPQGPGLSDGFNGWAAAGPEGIWWWKDASLAHELDRLYQAWDAEGRPAIGDYQVSFQPVQADFDPPPGGWQIERRFFRELLTASS